MSLETDADRLAMLQAVGEQVTLDGAAVWAVFDNAYAQVLDAVSAQPVLQLRSSDAAAVTRASTVVRGAAGYRVANIEPDGLGMTTLILERA